MARPRTPWLITALLILLAGAVPSRAAYRTFQLSEDFRLDEDNTGEIFGNVTQIRCDEAGNIYVLDNRLIRILEFDRTGTLMRTLSRKGEGPGEFQSAQDFFVGPDGSIGICRELPGRIEFLGDDGQPASGRTPLAERRAEGAFYYLMSAQRRGDLLGMLVRTERAGGAGKILEHQLLLARIDDPGETVIWHDTVETPWASFLERDHYTIGQSRWALTDAGVVLAPRRDSYRIELYDARGILQKVIDRNTPGCERSQDRLRERRERFDAIVARQPEYRVEFESYDPPISAVYARANGEFWVLPCRDFGQLADGVLAVLDAFDATGAPLGTVTLTTAEPRYVGRLFVLNADCVALSTYLVPLEDPGAEEEAELCIIVYRLEAGSN
ncbi:MAG: 6-bladed beta-propeller [Candidatus Krumholzibacteria bacterium]|nr:6-bladed beta-propeller [Candidatus Krumholzibacteria bacterium]